MIKVINSFNNENIKNIRKLTQKKEREKTSHFYVEGIRSITEAVQLKYPIEAVIYCPSLLISSHGQSLIQLVEQEGIEIWEVNEAIFKSFALKEGPHGIAAIMKQKWSRLNDISQLPGLWVGLEGAQDPGNVGSIMRTLDAVRGVGIILIDFSVDVFHPTAVRASTGAIFNIKLIHCHKHEFIEWKRENHELLIGMHCNFGKVYSKIHYPREMIIILGSEQKGLSDSMVEICDELVTIPMRGRVDSLNLACAASIIFYEIYNQQE